MNKTGNNADRIRLSVIRPTLRLGSTIKFAYDVTNLRSIYIYGCERERMVQLLANLFGREFGRDSPPERRPIYCLGPNGLLLNSIFFDLTATLTAPKANEW